jgi:ABC-2 type transport system permease protein
MRIGFTTVPTWQLVSSVVLLVLSAIGAVWLAGRAFRLGMLRYGQRLRWKEIFSHQGI